VYSHSEDLHDKFTGIPGSHAKSVEALRLLNAAGIRTLLKANVMNFNVDYLDEFISLVASVGADYRIDPTVKPKMDGDRSPLDFAVTSDELSRKVFNRPELAGALSLEDAEGICDGENPRAGKKGGMCAAGNRLIALHADGGIAPCALHPQTAGNIKTDTIDHIWKNSALFKEVRGQSFDEMNDCPKCDVRSSCNPCMAYALVEHGDHRACNTSSRISAEAKAKLAGKILNRARIKRARSLPIVGDSISPGIPVRTSTEL
jgi:radical SAM protein with 4Fe4S-binding SPASM domain